MGLIEAEVSEQLCLACCLACCSACISDLFLLLQGPSELVACTGDERTGGLTILHVGLTNRDFSFPVTIIS